MVIKYLDVELSECLNCLDRHFDIIHLLQVNELKNLRYNQVHFCYQLVFAVDVQKPDQLKHLQTLGRQNLIDGVEDEIRELVYCLRDGTNYSIDTLVEAFI